MDRLGVKMMGWVWGNTFGVRCLWGIFNAEFEWVWGVGERVGITCGQLAPVVVQIVRFW